jgi:hypothetical protein
MSGPITPSLLQRVWSSSPRFYLGLENGTCDVSRTSLVRRAQIAFIFSSLRSMSSHSS